jgi:hypothetical protein
MSNFGHNRSKDKHSALKTTQVASNAGKAINLVVSKLQWGKDDFGFSLHAFPSTFTTYGIQTTDFLSYLGFERGPCAFSQGGECFSVWVAEDFDINKFSEAFSSSFNEIKKAANALENCGYFLHQPEGWGFFYRKPGQDIARGYSMFQQGDGHTSPKTEVMKSNEDEYFKFILSWIEGSYDIGWTFHYRPKHSPLSPEFESVINYLSLNSFEECPCFDFEGCYWRFIPFEKRGKGVFDSNAEAVHRWFDAHPNNFSQGIESLLLAQSILDPFNMKFLPVSQKESVRREAQIERNIKRSQKPQITKHKPYEFDVAISFAGTERQFAEELANLVRDEGFDVFYDDFYPEQLWGRDLITFFDEVYRKRSRYCVIFVSEEYCKRMWTNHERKSAQARNLQQKGEDYILPIMVDKLELPGMPPTTGYLSLEKFGTRKIAELLIKRLKG